MFKKKKRNTKTSAESYMDNFIARENKMQQRLNELEEKKQLQLEKFEEKKQLLLEKQLKKQQEREFIMQTKLALKQERNNRKQSNINVNVLNKTNNNYVDKLTLAQGALDNNLLRLERQNNQVKSVEKTKESVQKEIERIEHDREKELENNNTIQNILLQKKKNNSKCFR